ncbi:hypothetical protein [Staphylococcus saprophyticus]|uniref:hypothetical protein n=1 Tax=Staphylococcus saprophyticus TaxID=29385 RepID=UPI000661181F|nr:hypothetical protein [Staphylococcus saprophyticus]AMG33599.1 hypothetical protein AL494_07490 [Staphylococcus saprophyticus]MBF2780643.1 hypothetical protein [Staphylococcus saprophyticus]MDW3837864.1 hypothetical protein [Staphylococcus saprophyticus]MDW4061890.1 hypothetical protein [Staphylococcus saprophyticus]MDW4104043.1 hypothetical protein [Staphylococcus saprophyticus]
MSAILTSLISSSVVAAIITYLSNVKIKNKELIVQIKLEEQNKWIANIDKSLEKFVECNIEYLNALYEYSLDKLDDRKISEYLLSSYKAQHSLTFYINQNEYNDELAAIIMDTIEEIVTTLKAQLTICAEVRSGHEDFKKVYNEMDNNEVNLGQFNVDLAMKVGNLAKEEKKALANEATKSWSVFNF